MAKPQGSPGVGEEPLLTKFEINCDMGEGFGYWKLGPDEELMPLIDRANIACGYHAGDHSIMRKSVALAKRHSVKVGSHPGFQDLKGLGRVRMDVSPDEIYEMILYQTGALKAFCDAEGVELAHIKPHGQLYFVISTSEAALRAALRACQVFSLPLVAARSAQFRRVAAEMGVGLIEEFYCDIDWTPERRLLPMIQSRPKTPAAIETAILDCALRGQVQDNQGGRWDFNDQGCSRFWSVCLHSDMPGAVDNVLAARRAVDHVNRSSSG